VVERKCKKGAHPTELLPPTPVLKLAIYKHHKAKENSPSRAAANSSASSRRPESPTSTTAPRPTKASAAAPTAVGA
jgi:hypothetical protein